METAPDLWHSLLHCSNSESTLVVCLCGGGSTSCVHPASLTWICYIKVKSVQGGGGGGMTVTNADTTLPYWHRYTLRARPAAVSVCILSCSSQVALKTNDNLSISLFVCCLFFFTLELSMVLTFTAAKKSIRPPQKSPHTQRLTHTTIERHTHILHTFFLWEPENYLCLSLNLNHYSYSIRLSLRLILTVTRTLSLF